MGFLVPIFMGLVLVSTSFAAPKPCDGRFSLDPTTATPGRDIENNILYFHNFTGSQIAILKDNTWWVVPFTKLELSAKGLKEESSYDIFASVDDKGALKTRFSFPLDENYPLQNDSIVLIDGVYMTAHTHERYLGTVRMNANGMFEDSAQNRFVYNQCNQVTRKQTISFPKPWTVVSTEWDFVPTARANMLELVQGLPNKVKVIAKSFASQPKLVSFAVALSAYTPCHASSQCRLVEDTVDEVRRSLVEIQFSGYRRIMLMNKLQANDGVLRPVQISYSDVEIEFVN